MEDILLLMRNLTNTLRQFGAGVILQMRQRWRVLFLLYLPIGLLFLVVGGLSRVSENVTLSLLMRDPAIMGRLPFYAGLVPQVETVLWSASLTVCLFTLYALQRRADHFAGTRRFLLQAAILTGLLMMDDIFLFHGEIAPKMLNIAGNVVIAAYLLMAIIMLTSNRVEIVSSEYLILLLALGLFGASISLDAVSKLTDGLPQFLEQIRVFLEDAIKFAGTATWLTYFVRYAIQKIDSISNERDFPAA
jgi:hypothetical protein